MRRQVLIIDDEEQLRKLLARVISLEGFEVTEAATLKIASDKLKQTDFHTVLCDVKLPDGNGVDFINVIKKEHPFTEVILLTAYGNIPDGVKAVKNGAFDYIVKGDDNDRIIPLLYQAVTKATQQKQNAVRIDQKHTGFHSVIGTSEKIKEAVNTAEKVAASDIPVLLLGETGTGKEVFANAIHQNSKRCGHPFIAINCSAFTKELLESELFGHKAGAYTGAVKDKKGLVEVADKGTLFLDEIGELHPDLQAKLLRFLENSEFIKLGDTKISQADTRIITATNRDLRTAIEEKRFRADLYFRLNVVTITLPTLRDRKEDIPLLAAHFLNDIAIKENKVIAKLHPDTLRLLQHYTWKGNVRELKNALARAVVLGNGSEILPADLPFTIQQQLESEELSLTEVENRHIRKILQHTNGNKTRAAQLMEIGLATLYRKMDEYGIPK